MIIDRFHEEVRRGTLYGDFQFAIDHESDDFLHRGIFSRYRPVADDTPIPNDQIYFSEDRWLALLRLARTRRTEAYHAYVNFYQSTDGQVYDSDTHQLSTYVPRYHDRLADLPPEAQGTEVISELYVPRNELPQFMRRAAKVLRSHEAPLTYGTLRLIRRDNESVSALGAGRLRLRHLQSVDADVGNGPRSNRLARFERCSTSRWRWMDRSF